MKSNLISRSYTYKNTVFLISYKTKDNVELRLIFVNFLDLRWRAEDEVV